MTTPTIQESKYKICTKNCLNYKHPGDDGCKKGNFVFQPPLGKRCAFSLLEGQMEKDLRSFPHEDPTSPGYNPFKKGGDNPDPRKRY